MDRLQRKCFVASAGVHSLLALILLIGPGFVSTKPKPDDMPILDFVPLKTVDALVSGGGNPNAKPPAPPAPQPDPPKPAAPQPEKIREPDPPKEIVRDPKPEVKPPQPEETLVPSPESKPKRPEISTKLITRPSPDTKSDNKAREDARAKQAEKEWADSRRRLANAIDRAAGNISSEVSGGTTVELKGPGGGGVPYANFLQAVKSIYTRAWIVPDGITDDDGTVIASVTIAKDGTVVSSRILRRSGNSAVDQSVQATLDRVRVAAPLPDDARESQRTVTINFNLKAKRALG
jgi:TonB family protein